MDPVAVLTGAIVPLIIGSLYAIVSRAVKRRVTIKSPEARALERIEASLNDIKAAQQTSAEAIVKVDRVLGHTVPAIKIVVKKVRQDLGKMEDGEEFNGDLDEAWQEIACAEQVYRDMRTIEVGGC